MLCPKDEETIVVNRAEVRGDRIVYDVRPASTQQIRRIEAEKANAVPMESSSEEFLRDLIDHLAGPMKARLASFLPLPTK